MSSQWGAIAGTFAIALASCVSAQPQGRTSSDERRVQRGIEKNDLNLNVAPCADFYEYANGAWRAANPIPASMQRWSRRVAAHEGNNERLRQILEDVSSKKDWPTGSTEQQVGDFYASCMDEPRIDQAGVTPLASLLAEIRDIRNLADLQGVIRKLHELAIPAPFGTTGVADYHQPDNFITNVVAGGLALPARDDYSSSKARSAEVRAKYRAHVSRVLMLAGMPEADTTKAADDVVALETRLAAASMTTEAAADPAATDHKMTFLQLKQLAPHVDWDRYFDEAKVPRIDVNVAEPEFLRQMDQELTRTPLAVWKSYLTWHLLDSASPWLSRLFVEESFEFREMKPRARRCADLTQELLGEPLGRLYVQRYFSPAAKAKAQEIAAQLLTALKEDVGGVAWMEADTKKKALQKLAGLSLQMGYPDRWKDLPAVVVRRDAFWANVVGARMFNVEDSRRQIGKPTDRKGWLLSPSSADAYLDPQLNELVLPAGFLQPPYFDLDATDAVNYGALGIGLAHDMTHAIDATGAELDVDGRPRKWWAEADVRAFEKRSRCVEEQFDGYFIEPGVHHQGKLVLTESVADLGGVRVAYLALQRSMKAHPVPTVDGFSPEQQFFISWGQCSGAASRLEAQREQLKADPHPVSKFRVIGPLSNSPEFEQAFLCPAGAEMVRPPEKRCAVW